MKEIFCSFSFIFLYSIIEIYPVLKMSARTAEYQRNKCPYCDKWTSGPSYHHHLKTKHSDKPEVRFFQPFWREYNPKDSELEKQVRNVVQLKATKAKYASEIN